MGPAGTAILGDVLVPQVSQIVGAVRVVPHPGIWKVNLLKRLCVNCFDRSLMLLPAC